MKFVDDQYPQKHVFFVINPHRCVRGSDLWNLWLTVSRFLSPVTLLLALKFATHFPCVGAVDLKACGDRLQEQQGATWNATHPTEPPPPFSLTYEQCLVECGAGVGGVNWQGLSQNFGAWLLPWITLMFQIPFGAERKFRHFVFTLR